MRPRLLTVGRSGQVDVLPQAGGAFVTLPDVQAFAFGTVREGRPQGKAAVRMKRARFGAGFLLRKGCRNRGHGLPEEYGKANSTVCRSFANGWRGTGSPVGENLAERCGEALSASLLVRSGSMAF
ncbi:MAG: hypothetical protein F4103_12330 [Boseongicola sp. SB0673_bin_14]|nr:hypothetical protein [Boseongicola sp. SB0673_bin_14]